MSGWIDYPVFYEPTLAQERLRGARKLRNYRIGSLIFSILITGVIWWFWRDQMGSLTWPILAIGLILPVIYLLRSIRGVRRAKSDADRVHDGLALGLGRAGLQVEGVWLEWPQVDSIAAAPASSGVSPELVVRPVGGQPIAVPLDYLTVLPATIDNGVRAMSDGHRQVDFSPLEP